MPDMFPPRPIGKFNEVPADSLGFMDLLLKRVDWEQLKRFNRLDHSVGRPAFKLSRAQLLVAIIFHYSISFIGTFAEHLSLLLGMTLAESTLSERRQVLPFEAFEELMRLILRPLQQEPAGAFYAGLKLVAIDGVQFSLQNTEQITKDAPRGGNQRARAAFPKLQCTALIELLMHNPLAAKLSCKGESEWALALKLIPQIPPKSLLLVDRLYGCGAFLVGAQKHLEQVQSHILARVKRNIKVEQIKRLPDGSCLVRIKALAPHNNHRIVGTMIVREILATVQRKGCKPVSIRLWTTLLDCQQAPAEELVRLYMSRWEQELYFRELKRELGVNDLLESQTPETAAQEVCAMIIGTSLLAHERSALRPGEELSHRISFIKLTELLEPLWLTLILGADILTEVQKQQLAKRFYDFAAKFVMQKKRNRSCPRVLRQPVQQWPRKRDQKSQTGPLDVIVQAG